MKHLTILLLLSFSFVTKGQSVEEVRNYLDSIDVKHKEIVLAQTVLETGWYTSYNCVKRNNITGFRHSSKITESNKYGYYTYSSWQECLDHYKRWQLSKYCDTVHSSYYSFLNDIGYAEEGSYINILQILVLQLCDIECSQLVGGELLFSLFEMEANFIYPESLKDSTITVLEIDPDAYTPNQVRIWLEEYLDNSSEYVFGGVLSKETNSSIDMSEISSYQTASDIYSSFMDIYTEFLNNQ